MKYLKILGLAAVAAAALMAFVGASSASADVLCEENNTPECGAGKQITHIEASQVGTGTLNTTGGATLAKCSGASMTAEDTEGSATHEPGGPVSFINWSGCNTTVDTISPGHLSIETTVVEGVHHDTVVSSGGTVTIELFGISCEYTTGTGTSLGDLSTGEPAILNINAVVLKDGGGGLCPGSGVWQATMQITNHTGVWLSEK